MIRTVRRHLDKRWDDYSIVCRLHDVPTHAVYEVSIDGRRAVYKGDTGPTGNAAVEGHVTRFVNQETVVPVPEILHVGEGHYIAEWHPTAPTPDERHDTGETWASAAGRGLSMLHAGTAELLDQYGQFRSGTGDITVDGHDSWYPAVKAYVERHRPVLARYGHADVADAVAESVQKHPSRFDGAGEPVCCHGWATAEHVSVVDGRVACVVDFEHAIAAPAEFDYWRTSMPTFRSKPGELARAFREGYESIRPLRAGFEDRRPVYVMLNLLYYVQALHVQDQHGPTDTTDRAERLRGEVFARLDELE